VIVGEIPRLVEETRKLNPQKIIIVKASIFAVVKEALETAGLGDKILNHAAIPFSSHGNQKKYRQMLSELTMLRKKSSSD
jgi:hypothetical protein